MQQEPIMPQNNIVLWIAIGVAIVLTAAVGWYLLSPDQHVKPTLTSGRTKEPAEPTAEATPPSAETPTTTSLSHGPEADPLWVGRIAALRDMPTQTNAAQAAEMREELIDLLRPIEQEKTLAALDGPQGSAYALVSETAVALAKHPPIASGEVESYRAILANLSHIARVFGKQRTLSFRSALDARGAELEPLAAASYRWLLTRETHGEGAEREITLARLYDYASFLLNTLGGQSYLQRRLPREEALVSFYALLIVDRARKAGISSHGTDPRPHFPRVRQLLKTQGFIYRDHYLAILDQLEADWP